jgi:hypothetical protein
MSYDKNRKDNRIQIPGQYLQKVTGTSNQEENCSPPIRVVDPDPDSVTLWIRIGNPDPGARK